MIAKFPLQQSVCYNILVVSALHINFFLTMVLISSDDSPCVVGRGVSTNGVEVDANIEVASADVEIRAARLLRMTDGRTRMTKSAVATV